MFNSKGCKRYLSTFGLILFLVLPNSTESHANDVNIAGRNGGSVPVTRRQSMPNPQVSSSRNLVPILPYHQFGTPPASSSTTHPGLERISGSKNNSLSPFVQARNQPYYEQSDTRIPFWNIAHMINSIDQIEPALRDGANGIEVDVSFDKRGFPVESYHGFPCDCGRHCHHREDLTKFVQHIARLTSPPATSRLQVIVFDLKLKDLNLDQKEVGGRLLATILHEHLYKRYQATAGGRADLIRPPLRVVVSINHVADSVLVRSFLNYMIENRLDFMGSHVGFDVGMNDDLNEINAMWRNFNGATLNIWQGDGLTNCANIIRGVDRLKDAISIRNGQGHFRKIYYWTADVMYQIRSVLRLGIDAILTNQPQRLIQVLDETEFKDKYRLATPYDDPFAQFLIQPSAWGMSSPTLDELEETVTNIKKTSANFVKTLPDGIAAALKKVHNSIVSSN